LFHISKVSGTTNSFRHFTLTIDKAYNGHSKSIFRHPVLEINVIIEKANRVAAFTPDDNLPVDKGARKLLDQPILPALSKGSVPSLRLLGPLKKRLLWQLVIPLRHPALAWGNRPCAFQPGHHRHWGDHCPK